MQRGTSTFEQKLRHLDAYLAEWATKGFEVRNNRIGRYRSSLERLIELGPDGRGRIGEQEAADAVLMLEEIEQFIFTSARTLPYPHLVASKQAKEMFSGSDLSKNEGRKKSPRDYMFELSTAGLIEASGIGTDVSNLVDIRAPFEGKPVFVECKRPESLEKLPTHVRKAAQQLEAHLKAEPSGVGIVAIAFGKIITKGTMRLAAWDEAEVDAMVKGATDILLKEMHRHLKMRTAVRGIIAQVSVVGINGSESRPFVGMNYVADRLIRGKETRDDELVGRFLHRLATGILKSNEDELNPAGPSPTEA